MQGKFIIHEQSKMQVLQSIGKSFKNFKYTLTNWYILPNKNDHKKLRKPPLRYYYIRQGYWDSLVKDRIDDKFEVRKLNLIQYFLSGNFS